MGQNITKKYYAVAKGRKVGIFNTWDEVKDLVDGFPNSKYESFETLEEAQKYLSGDEPVFLWDSIKNNQIIIYTDGSCIDSIGGYGYLTIDNDVITPVCGKVRIDFCTREIAELYAIYMSLVCMVQEHNKSLVDLGATIYTDSKYCIDCLTEWNHNWKNNGWVTSEPVKNVELIRAILGISVGLNIKYKHIKDHGQKYNEWADRLANMGRKIENIIK